MATVTSSRAKALSVVFANFAAVFLGSLVIPVFNGGIDIEQLPVVLSGLLATIFSTWLSLIFAERGKL